MNAFGRRNGVGTAQRPGFGVARPMQSGGAPRPDGGEQFPALDTLPLPGELAVPEPAGNMPGVQQDAMQRLADRQAASGEAGNSRVEGFESSIHKIKEQVLPRLLERVDPEAAALHRPRHAEAQPGCRSHTIPTPERVRATRS